MSTASRTSPSQHQNPGELDFVEVLKESTYRVARARNRRQRHYEETSDSDPAAIFELSMSPVRRTLTQSTSDLRADTAEMHQAAKESPSRRTVEDREYEEQDLDPSPSLAEENSIDENSTLHEQGRGRADEGRPLRRCCRHVKIARRQVSLLEELAAASKSISKRVGLIERTQRRVLRILDSVNNDGTSTIEDELQESAVEAEQNTRVKQSTF